MMERGEILSIIKAVSSLQLLGCDVNVRVTAVGESRSAVVVIFQANLLLYCWFCWFVSFFQKKLCSLLQQTESFPNLFLDKGLYTPPVRHCPNWEGSTSSRHVCSANRAVQELLPGCRQLPPPSPVRTHQDNIKMLLVLRAVFSGKRTSWMKGQP